MKGVKMHLFSMGVALLIAVAIIVIGLAYIVQPRAASTGFGLPLPETGQNMRWWLSLKGVRDVVSGLILLALILWGTPAAVGIVLLVAALTPLGDMGMILAAKGSSTHAFGIHAVTAAVMIAGAVPLILGVA
jgi:hypothetical protein